MRPRTTLIVVGLALGAALFFFLVEEPRYARKTQRAASEQRLTPTRAEDVYAVSILRPDIAITAAREGEHWKVMSPVVDVADDPAFNTLVLTTCRAVVERRFDVEESRLPEYGLAPPLATMRFEAKDGEGLLEVRIGDLNPSGSHCYALAGGASDVLLLPSGVRRYALRSLFEFRDKRIIDVEVSDVARIEIASRGRATSWTALETGKWFNVQKGDTTRGDKTAVESVVRELRGLRARDILAGEPSVTEARFLDRSGTIRLSTRRDSAGVTLTFGAPRGDSCYVETSGRLRVASVDTTILAVFRKTADDFRDRRILTYAKDSIAKIVWETPAQTITILKTDDAWSYANPGFGQIGERAIHRLFSTLETLEFTTALDEDFAEMTGHGFDTPLLRLTLFDAGDRVIDETAVGSLAPDGSSRYVSSRSTGILAGIAPASVSRLENDLADLRGP